MTHKQLDATNTLKAQTNVAPRDGTGAKVDGTTLRVSLPPYSYQMLRVKV
jgi:alpha-L-arabinofuranosidase